MVVITIWLTVAKYPFLKWQWIFYFLRDVSFLYHRQDFCRTWLYIWVARWVSYKKQELLTLREHFSSPPFCSVLLVLVFLSCPIMCLYVLTSVWFVFVCVQWCPTHIALCFCFVFVCLMYPMLPVSLIVLFDYLFGILWHQDLWILMLLLCSLICWYCWWHHIFNPLLKRSQLSFIFFVSIFWHMYLLFP